MKRRVAKKIRRRFQELYDYVKAVREAEWDRNDAPMLREIMGRSFARGNDIVPPEKTSKPLRPWPRYRKFKLGYTRDQVRAAYRRLSPEERTQWWVEDAMYRSTMERWRDPWGHAVKVAQSMPSMMAVMADHITKQNETDAA